jgi:hypothetical protein
MRSISHLIMATPLSRTSSPISSPTLAEDLSKLSLGNDSECDIVLQVNDGGVSLGFTGTLKSATTYTLSVRTEENGQFSTSFTVRADTSISEPATPSFAATRTSPCASPRKTSTPRRPPPPLKLPNLTRPGIGHRVPPQPQRSVSSPSLSHASTDCTLPPSNGRLQCSGGTQGKGQNPEHRCSREVGPCKVLSHVDPDHEIKRFCFDHHEKMLKNPGFRLGSGSMWVNFSGM